MRAEETGRRMNIGMAVRICYELHMKSIFGGERAREEDGVVGEREVRERGRGRGRRESEGTDDSVSRKGDDDADGLGWLAWGFGLH